MTTITDKISEPLKVLQIFTDVENFSELISLIRNDLMGISNQPIPVKKMAKKFGIDDPQYLQDAIDAVAYLILHMAKVNANESEFLSIYDAVGLNANPTFKKAMYDVVFPNIASIREMLMSDNELSTVRFQDLDWRLSVVMATRSRHNIMLPKYTLKFDLVQDKQTTSVIMDSDYNNLKRL